MKVSFSNILQKIKKPFQQGLSSGEVIKAIIVSLFFTVVPVFGITTLLLAAIAIKIKLNLPIMVIISYIATPLQFLLFLPFIHTGEIIFNAHHTLLSVQEIKNAFNISFWNTFQSLLFVIICGISGWLVVALPISLSGILLSNKIHKSIQSKNETN